MVRVSDILRRMHEDGEKPPKRDDSPPRKEMEPKVQLLPPEKEAPVPFRKEIFPTTQLGAEDAEETYQRLLDFIIHSLVERVREGKAPAGAKEIEEAASSVVDRLQKGDTQLLFLSGTRMTPDCYIYAHAANCCILTCWIGMGFRYPREHLVQLAMASLVHDLGMEQVMDIVQKPSLLTSEELAKVREHTRFTVETLRKIAGLPKLCVEIAETIHERFNGKGYPAGRSGPDLSIESQCVAICDVYEALTHPRAYREKLSPHMALKTILEIMKEFFNLNVLKVFMQQLTVFPAGSWVELSTGERGQVIGIRTAYPLRPVVKIYFDVLNNKIAVPRTIDLSRHVPLYVKRSLEEKEMGGKLKGVS
ncbi:MAG: HD domain-containing phosphohydrolase [Candidatus Omnitrophota bacterium]